MTHEIHWLRRASNELDAIYRFYSEFASKQVAKRRVGKKHIFADLKHQQ